MTHRLRRFAAWTITIAILATAAPALAQSLSVRINGGYTWIDFFGIAAPALGPTGAGRLYYDSATNKFRVSENGAAFADLGSGAIAAGWTDDGTVVRFTTASDALAIGQSTQINSSTVSILGNSANPAITIRQDGTGNLFSLLNGANEQFVVTDGGIFNFNTGTGSLKIRFETANDRYGFGAAGVSGVNVHIPASSASTVPLNVRGAASQTGSLLQLQNSTPTTLLSVSSAGAITVTADSLAHIFEPTAVTADGGTKDSNTLRLRGKHDSDPTAGVTSANFDISLVNVQTTAGTSPASRATFLHNDGSTVLAAIFSAGGMTIGNVPALVAGSILTLGNGNLVWNTDASYDIGDTTHRPRDLYVGREVIVSTPSLGAGDAAIQALDLGATWNSSGTTFTAVKLNVTNTFSAAGSLLLDLQVDAATKFKVDKNGYGYGGVYELSGGCTTVPTTGSTHISVVSISGCGAESARTAVVGRNARLIEWVIHFTAAPGAGVTHTLQAKKNGANITSATCTVSGASATTCTITAGLPATLVSGDYLSLQNTVSGGTAAAADARVAALIRVDP